ncbi:uncharacterized protein [Watersipora subatra]|uniref:uncharacterized protein n=1 Tax=Watersipora subatra TaxID=2589382 RepID=UPI00355C0E89
MEVTHRFSAKSTKNAKETSLKKMRLSSDESFLVTQDKMVELVLGKVAKRKTSAISLSNNTIRRRITEMSENIKKHALKTTMRASDILDKVSQFFETEKLSWGNLCGCCNDGAPSMLGSSSGFQAKLRQLVSVVKGVHQPKDKEPISMPESLQSNIRSHLDSLESEFQHYFPEVKESELSLVRSPFHCFAGNVPDKPQGKLINFQNDSSAKDFYEDKTIEEFWLSMIHSYPQTAKHAP